MCSMEREGEKETALFILEGTKVQKNLLMSTLNCFIDARGCVIGIIGLQSWKYYGMGVFKIHKWISIW